MRWALAAAQQGDGAARLAAGRGRYRLHHQRQRRRDLAPHLRALAGAEREVSPTRFHNSVHNAAAGYWTHRGRLAPAVGEPVRLRRFVCGAGSSRRRVRSRRKACRSCWWRTICRTRPALRRAPVRVSAGRFPAPCAATRVRNACLPACRGRARNRRRSRPFPRRCLQSLRTHRQDAACPCSPAWPAANARRCGSATWTAANSSLTL